MPPSLDQFDLALDLLRAYQHNTHLVADDVPYQDMVEWKREMRRLNKKTRKLLAEITASRRTLA